MLGVRLAYGSGMPAAGFKCAGGGWLTAPERARWRSGSATVAGRLRSRKRKGQTRRGSAEEYIKLYTRLFFADEDGQLDPVLRLLFFAVGLHTGAAHDVERTVEGIVEQTQVGDGALDTLPFAARLTRQ